MTFWGLGAVIGNCMDEVRGGGNAMGTKHARSHETVMAGAAFVAWAGVVAVAVAGCGGVGGIPIDDTASRIATPSAQGLDVLHGRPALDQQRGWHRRARLRDGDDRQLQEQLTTLQQSVNQKRATYQSSQLDACLATVQSADCATLNVTNHLQGVPGCASFTTPLVVVGGGCSQDYECINGWCNVPMNSSNGEGVCAAFVAIGQSCAAAGGPSCGPSAVCDPEGTLRRQLRQSLRAGLRQRRRLHRRLPVHQPQLHLERRQRDVLRAPGRTAGRDVLLQQRLLGGGRPAGRGDAASVRRLRRHRLPARRPRTPPTLIRRRPAPRRFRYAAAMPEPPPSLAQPPAAVKAESAPPACAIDPDSECPACAARGLRVKMYPVKAHYQCPECHYFDSCCM